MFFYTGTFLALLISVASESRESSLILCKVKDCSHTCEIVDKLPICTCPQNMKLGPDTKTCQVPKSFLLAMYRGVKLFSEGSDELRTIIPNRVTALDYHYGRQEMFAYSNNSILRVNLREAGSSATSVDLGMNSTDMVSSLAVDWVQDNLYWITQQGTSVESVSIGGGNVEVIVSNIDSDNNFFVWHNLVIDPYVKKLFWLGKTGVYSFDLESKSLKNNLISGRLQPSNIALDTSSRLIYLIGHHENDKKMYLTRCRYDGSPVGEELIIPHAGSKVFGFGVLGDTLYWESNHDGENVYKGKLNHDNKDSSSIVGLNVTLMEELNQIVYDMKIFHPDIQKPMK